MDILNLITSLTIMDLAWIALASWCGVFWGILGGAIPNEPVRTRCFNFKVPSGRRTINVGRRFQ